MHKHLYTAAEQKTFRLATDTTEKGNLFQIKIEPII